jgi:hypothetical protein
MESTASLVEIARPMMMLAIVRLEVGIIPRIARVMGLNKFARPDSIAARRNGRRYLAQMERLPIRVQAMLHTVRPARTKPGQSAEAPVFQVTAQMDINVLITRSL